MTRYNDADLDVANRQVWTVTGITDTGHAEVVGDNYRQTILEPDYVREFLHLAYATTGYGVQGETATHADVLVSMSTDAAGAYVGRTRGRHSNLAVATATQRTSSPTRSMRPASSGSKRPAGTGPT